MLNKYPCDDGDVDSLSRAEALQAAEELWHEPRIRTVHRVWSKNSSQAEFSEQIGPVSANFCPAGR